MSTIVLIDYSHLIVYKRNKRHCDCVDAAGEAMTIFMAGAGVVVARRLSPPGRNRRFTHIWYNH